MTINIIIIIIIIIIMKDNEPVNFAFEIKMISLILPRPTC